MCDSLNRNHFILGDSCVAEPTQGKCRFDEEMTLKDVAAAATRQSVLTVADELNSERDSPIKVGHPVWS